ILAWTLSVGLIITFQHLLCSNPLLPEVSKTAQEEMHSSW
ncbi:hypothetical protein scyTo_0017381, partial [Scyliorhinus torazame]|nr:hypothetical protein [Scyliorhinus torazame]